MLCDREATEKVSILILIFNLNLMENTFCVSWHSHRQLRWPGRGDGSGPLGWEVLSLPGSGADQERRPGSRRTKGQVSLDSVVSRALLPSSLHPPHPGH